MRPNDIAAKAEPFIRRLEYVDDEKAERNAEFAEAKKIIFEEAEYAGIQPKALRAVLKRRKAERAERNAFEKFDIDEKAQFEALAAAFGDLPFGEFARDMAEQFLAQTDPDEAALAEEERLQHIGRGPRPAGDDIDGLAGS